MNLSRPVQFGVMGALALLMIATRGQHFASVDALPSASWAVFFLAGLFFRPLWGFAALFALATVLDLASLKNGTVTQWCLSPAYWALLPAYGSLWFAGRLYSSIHRDELRTLLPLASTLAASGFVAYLCSGGGFYFFSGHYPDASLAEFAARIAQYYPHSTSVMAGYVIVAAVVYATLRLLAPRNALARA